MLLPPLRDSSAPRVSRGILGNGRRSRRPCLLGGALAAASALSGCLLNPTDDGRVDSRTDPLLFGGYHIEAAAPVQVRAWDFEANEMVDVGAPARSSKEATMVDGARLHEWAAWRTLDERFWRRGPVSGYCAVTGASGTWGDEEYSLGSFDPDWAACFDDDRDVLRFAKRCVSGQKTTARVYTRDWAPAVVTQEELDQAAAVASSLIRITIDNYTHVAAEHCGAASPEGCPQGDASDWETYKFYSPEASFLRQGREQVRFSIAPTRREPMTVYIDDMRSRAIDFRVDGARLVLGVDFESAGIEIRMNCIRHFACMQLDGMSIDFAAPRAELSFQLAARGGKVAYSEVTAGFTTGTAGDGAEAAGELIGKSIGRMLRTDAAIRKAVSAALDAVVRGLAGLDAYPIERVTVRDGSIDVLPGCPMD